MPARASDRQERLNPDHDEFYMFFNVAAFQASSSRGRFDSMPFAILKRSALVLRQFPLEYFIHID